MNHPNSPLGHFTIHRFVRSRLLPRLTVMFLLLLCTGAILPLPSQTSAQDGTSTAAAPKVYDRHFVVVVDQTVFFPGQHGGEGMGAVYSGLKGWLKGQSALGGIDRHQTSFQRIAPFNEQHDQLTVFAFALQGRGASGEQSGTSYAFVNWMSRQPSYSDRDVYDCLVQRLITRQADFRSSQLTLDRFFAQSVRPIFNGNNALFRSIADKSAITLSYYVYPLIFDRLQESTPAKQIILVVVSDFNSGSFNENASKDRQALYDLLAHKNDRFNYVLQRVEQMKQPYTQVELAHLVSPASGGTTIVAKATALVMKESVMHSPLFIASNLDLRQRGTSHEFTMCPSTVSFNKSDSIVVDKVEIVVSAHDEPDRVLCRLTAEGYKYDAARHEFRFPALDLGLPTTSPGDLRVTYHFYTHSTAGGESLLPFLYTAERTIAQSDIYLTNAKLQRIVTMITIAAIIILLLLILFYLGRKKTISLRIGNFSQKFTNVTAEHGAEELPCWFYAGQADTTRRIRLDGQVSRAHAFGLPVSSRVSVRLQNLAPHGFTCYLNGRQLTDQWTPVEKKGRNTFTLVLNVQADPAQVNPDDVSTVSADIDVRVDSSVFGLWRHTDVDASHQLRFFFTRDRGTAWVGFDPGTTGSCVAYGNTGGTLDDPAIRLAKDELGQTIYPSCLGLDKDFGQKPVEQLVPGVDYQYGSKADANSLAWRNEGTPVFRSIKKLLGYQNDIEATIGRTHRTFKGVELAHMLVKGLQLNLEQDVRSLSAPDRMRYVGPAGQAQRAVVAIPNNYTLPKILDMVNSVRRLPQFHEVRFVYEAEAVLFNYLSQNFSKQQPGEETVMVYDMGGATINVSVFRVRYIERGGTIYYHIETLGRIGYGVGGDNIDVALMEHLLRMSCVQGTGGKGPQLRRFELAHKEQILRAILDLKKAIIRFEGDGYLGKENPLLNDVAFRNFMNSNLLKNTKANCSIDHEHYNPQDMCNELLDSEELAHFVYDNIDDVVSEILHYPDVSALTRIDTIIFSGRSTLFPQVKNRVQSALAKHFSRGNAPHMYPLDDRKVKTAVAYGACWYGIYNSLVTLDNSRLASAYGFKLTTCGHAGLEVLLRQNCRFDESGNISATSRQLDNAFAADGNQVNFYQIMGSGQGENLFSADNRHKVNYIGTLPATTLVENVSMSVTRNNIVTCEVTYDNGGQMAVNNIQVQGRDITDENDWAYVFATSAQTADNLPDSMLEDTHRERRTKAAPRTGQPRTEQMPKDDQKPQAEQPKSEQRKAEPKADKRPNYVPETKASRMPNPIPPTKPNVPRNINRL